MRKADPDGKYPMSGKEHLALRTLYGAVNALLTKQDDIKERVALLGMTEDYEKITDKFCELLAGFLNTIPVRKQEMVRKEMNNTILTVSIGRNYTDHNSNGCYIDSEVLMRLINLCMKDHCFVCEKTYKEGTRHCEIYKAIADCYAYELVDEETPYCPLQGVWEIEEDPEFKP